MAAKAPLPPDAWLELPDGHVHRFRGECAIGRLPDNHLVLADAAASRHHARINPLGTDRYALADLGSANGTYLNSLRLDPAVPAPLRDRDVITIGAAQLRFRLVNHAAEIATETGPAPVSRKKILLVGETSLAGEGLRRVLDAQPEYSVAGHASDASRARQLHVQLHPDVVILDASVDAPGALSLIRDLLAVDSDTRLLAIVERADPDFVPRLMRTGALGCVLRADPAEDLLRALAFISAGASPRPRCGNSPAPMRPAAAVVPPASPIANWKFSTSSAPAARTATSPSPSA
jgi:predicted component of type VI protein secretion system